MNYYNLPFCFFNKLKFLQSSLGTEKDLCWHFARAACRVESSKICGASWVPCAVFPFTSAQRAGAWWWKCREKGGLLGQGFCQRGRQWPRSRQRAHWEESLFPVTALGLLYTQKCRVICWLPITKALDNFFQHFMKIFKHTEMLKEF